MLDNRNYTDIKAIWDEVKTSAQIAAQVEDVRLGQPEQSRGLDCGFAWIELRPARGKLVQYLKAHGIGRKGWNGGWHVWYSYLHNVPTQSISVHTAAVNAAVMALGKYNIVAHSGSRLD